MRRIGVLVPQDQDSPVAQARIAALLQELRQLGWTGRNARIDIHWAGAGAESIRKHAAELGSLGGSVRLFLQRDAVDGCEIGSEPRHLSSTGAIVAPLVARQDLEIRVLHDLGHSGSHVDFASRLAAHVMKMMAHRQWRRSSLADAALRGRLDRTTR
jgi:hypothetical protein